MKIKQKTVIHGDVNDEKLRLASETFSRTTSKFILILRAVVIVLYRNQSKMRSKKMAVELKSVHNVSQISE